MSDICMSQPVIGNEGSDWNLQNLWESATLPDHSVDGHVPTPDFMYNLLCIPATTIFYTMTRIFSLLFCFLPRSLSSYHLPQMLFPFLKTPCWLDFVCNSTCVTINPCLEANDKLDLLLAWTQFQRRADGAESAGTERARKTGWGGLG
jgi:hypothetical protein